MMRRLRAMLSGRRRRRLALVASAGMAIAVPLALHVGLLSRPSPWQEATGWECIPASERPAGAEAWAASGSSAPPRISWLGHAGFVVRWHGALVLLDPNASARCTISRRILELPESPESLGHVDAIVLSHAHFDHMDAPTLASLGDVGQVLLPAGAETWLPASLRAGARVVPMHDGDSVSVGELEITAVPAAHEGNRWHPFEGRVGALGWVLRAGTDAIYFAGDTAITNDFAAIREAYHPRLAILPIGAWLPRIPMKYYHLSPEEAVQAARTLGVETVVPCHFGTFTVSLDRPSWALPRFAHAAHEAGLAWEMPVLLGAADPPPGPGSAEARR